MKRIISRVALAALIATTVAPVAQAEKMKYNFVAHACLGLGVALFVKLSESWYAADTRKHEEMDRNGTTESQKHERCKMALEDIERLFATNLDTDTQVDATEQLRMINEIDHIDNNKFGEFQSGNNIVGLLPYWKKEAQEACHKFNEIRNRQNREKQLKRIAVVKSQVFPRRSCGFGKFLMAATVLANEKTGNRIPKIGIAYALAATAAHMYQLIRK